jgi:hypothetical protein
MKDVFTTPEANPDSSGATSFIAASSTGLKAMPAPRPSSTMLGSTSNKKVPLSGARASQARPTAAMARPIHSGPRMPKRMTIFADSPAENAAMIVSAGRNARPTCSGS